MALVFDKQEDIPEAIRADFVEVGGKWVPDGYVPAETHQEMKRKANPDRLAELEKLAKKLDGVDPDEAIKAIQERDRLQREAKAKAAGVDPEKLDALREEWTGNLKSDHETALEAERTKATEAEKKAAEAQNRLDRLEIETQINRHGAKLGLLPGAVPDATSRALSAFKREEGKLVPRKEDGTLLYIDNKEASLETWLASQRDESGHWFRAPASGSGASGNEAPGGASKTRPHSDYDNMTPAERVEFAESGGEFV